MIKLFQRKKTLPKNVKGLARELDRAQQRIAELEKKIKGLERESRLFIKKMGVVRYKAFSNMGGNQSFSLAVLNEKDTGFVITSLYLKEKNRLFVKSVKKGKTDYSLSEKEKEAIQKARNIYDTEKK